MLNPPSLSGEPVSCWQGDSNLPTPYVLFKFLLPLGISPTIASGSQLLEFGFHLGFGFWVYRELAFAFHYIKEVTKVFHTLHIGHNCLVPVHLQMKFSLVLEFKNNSIQDIKILRNINYRYLNPIFK